MIAIASIVQSNLLLLVSILVGVAVILKIWIGTTSGRGWLDTLKLKMPFVGHLWTMFSMAQLARTLATLLQGGTPLLSALEVVRDASGNLVIADSIGSAVVEVREGKTLSDSLERTGHFPELALEMIRVGEQTGSVPEMLGHVADFYDEDVNIKSAALLSFVEPVILIFVALFVAVVLISLYLPIFSIRETVQT
jgi:type IV pilus assembly protein PilC